jgi:hypothetical protein
MLECLLWLSLTPSQQRSTWHKKEHRMHSNTSFRLNYPPNNPLFRKILPDCLHRAERAAVQRFSLPCHVTVGSESSLARWNSGHASNRA